MRIISFVGASEKLREPHAREMFCLTHFGRPTAKERELKLSLGYNARKGSVMELSFVPTSVRIDRPQFHEFFLTLELLTNR